MARINGFRKVSGEVGGQSNGLAHAQEPPPSTIASHLPSANGHRSAEFDRDSFDQLLEVSLGDDENGQPNLRDDAEENHKLIRVVVEAGIDPVAINQDNPFHAQRLGRDTFRITRCIEVLRLAVDKSPRVLFLLSQQGQEGAGDGKIPTFAWVIPKILPLISNVEPSSEELSQKACDFLLACLSVETECEIAGFNCKDMLSYVKSCVDGILEQLEACKDSTPTSKMVISNEKGGPLALVLSTLNLDRSSFPVSFAVGNKLEAFSIASGLLSIMAQSILTCPAVHLSAKASMFSGLLRQLDNLWSLLSESVFRSETPGDHDWALMLKYFQILDLGALWKSDMSTAPMKSRLSLLWAKSLEDLLAELCKNPSNNLQATLLAALEITTKRVQKKPEMYVGLLEILGPQLQSLLYNATFQSRLMLDLKTIIARLFSTPQRLPIVTDIRVSTNKESWPDEGRAPKRLRLSTEEPAMLDVSPQREICRKLTKMLSGQPVSDLIGLSKSAPPHFRSLSDEEQCQGLEVLERAACSLSASTVATACSDLENNVECEACDTYHFNSRDKYTNNLEASEELIRTLLAIGPSVTRSSKARVAATLALQRLLVHCDSPGYLKLNQSLTGDWCLQSLRSSSRDVRIAATQLLRPFVIEHPRLDLNMIRSNRIVALDFLQNLWTRNEVTTQETTVLALTTIARVAGDEEMNIILVRLVEYLAHGNPYINGLVYAEVQNLAEALQMSVSTLLSQYWRTVGVVIIKNFQTRPAVAQQLCDLLGWHVDGLLVRIEDFALPYLVLMKKTDIISRIAAAHEPPSTPFNICTQRQALQNILSFLLTQSFTDPEETIMSLLLAVSEDFDEHDLVTWLGLESTAVACELLKAIVDAGEGRGAGPRQGLHFLAQAISRKAGHSSGSRKTDNIGAFLESHALAITNQFIFTLNNAREPDVEKRRCLAAIGQVARLGKSRILDALPQICACLRSSMENRDLCDAAFASWAMMVNGLKESDMEPLIDQTLAIIVRSWEMFSPNTQQLAQEVVASLLKNHSSLIREIFSTMPSLTSIPLLAKVASEVEGLKHDMDERYLLTAFTKRIANENLAVVEQALKELTNFLYEKPELLQRSILREQPDSYVAELIRSLLDCCSQFNESTEVTRLCGQCLGHIGCVDPSKIETVHEKNSIILLSSFAKADETVDFIIFFLEHILVKAFLSASSTRSQGFLGWAMQELLKLCNLDQAVALRSRSNGSTATHRRWMNLPENVRNTLTPFSGSRYVVQDIQPPGEFRYPLFEAGKTSYLQWLRTIVLDLLHRAPGENPQLIFSICCRIISGQDVAIPSFLLPFAALNLVVSGVEEDKMQIVQEMLNILQQPMEGDRQTQENVKLCSESVFDILDYMFKWLQQKRKQHAAALVRLERGVADPSFESAQAQIKSVESLLEAIPPDLMSRRAIDCKSYARALFNWENYIRQSEKRSEGIDDLLEHLQDIYAQIDEPDGIEGISSRLHVLNIEQQVLEHRKAGRWTAAQSWYEMQLVKDPEDTDTQVNLMQCLKESGQYDILLHHFDALNTKNSLIQVLPYAVEASWVTNRWDKLATYLGRITTRVGDFNLNVAFVLHALHLDDSERAQALLDELEGALVEGFTTNTTSSVQSAHDTLLKLHALRDIRIAAEATEENKMQALTCLERRLDILGSYVADKQYVLGIRKAAMELSPVFNKYDIASAWLCSARLARKAQSSNQAFNAILHASALGEKSATIEQAKLMWQEGHHRKAIQTLEGAIESGAFVSHNFISDNSSVTFTAEQLQYQNEVTAKAYALLGKWLDNAGQTQSDVIIKTFQKAANHHKRWEKGHYYLGKYYNKIVDSERGKVPGKESQTFLTGEAAKLVIDNFLRSSSFGSKYVFQTLPKILTLWLELVAGSEQPQDARRGNEKFQVHTAAQRKIVVADTNKQMTKYAERLQPIVLYTILPQIVARICHANTTVYNILEALVVRVTRAFPQQALWILLAVLKSQSKDRASRGLKIVAKACEKEKKTGRETSSAELRSQIVAGQKLFDEILRVSNFPIEGKTPRVSLARDLGFNHKIAPSRLVVPVEGCLIPNLPSNYDTTTMQTFRPFSKEAVTITAFLDEALVLASLQKPRKLSIRGSDGNIYGALAKPKDDMRKDQRLMEFNTMINRFLKRDVEASKRRLYIRTYAVVPLNEECGLIEWVDNLKTFRDIVLKLYKEKNISPNYTEIRTMLEEASSGPPEKYSIFRTRILKNFPSLFHEWFVESFPDPTAWFNARLRYTRSCAVMSIVGHVLGLGDRHGENILFEEDNGGTLHVDFNCLFDKGLTFEKPEMVPFRLTHNMVDAFGAYGYDGPFRRCCEITLTLLRGNEDALMTILETFLHDPTTDFINAGKRKKAGVAGVPDTPMGVLDSVRGKVRGMLAGESVPLSVGGYVEEMIKRAVDEGNLCKMYIGWCAFF